MRTGTAQLPLHGGHCPRWLYVRMVEMAGLLVEAIVEEFGPDEVLCRLADPGWFQAFGAVLGFDWHSSGLTTVTTAAMKEALQDRQEALGLVVAGGKGKASRSTPEEIAEGSERIGLQVPVNLADTSRLVAKVDNTAVQDGYQLYHHVFVFTRTGRWAVIQQGMPREGAFARRYHWLSEAVSDPVNEPHQGLRGDPARIPVVMDMTAGVSAAAREATVRLLREQPIEETVRGLAYVREHNDWVWSAGHAVPRAAYLDKLLFRLYDAPPDRFQGLLTTEGVGPGSLRALVMVAEMIYGVTASREDPLRYSFAHGGKDGHPYPVARAQYDHSIGVLRRAISRARLGQPEAMKALRRLAAVAREEEAGHPGTS
jgi:hypothetical protein